MDAVERWHQAQYETPWGTGSLSVCRGRLVGVELPEGAAGGQPPEAGEPSAAPEQVPSADRAVAARWAAELEAYFRGERLAWTAGEIPLTSLPSGEFERRVYQALLTIPPAVTVSYGTLAELAGYPRAARAVGNVMAANPLPVVIPCHRVVRADGSLGHYGNDPAWKLRLLEHEAAHVEMRS